MRILTTVSLLLLVALATRAGEAQVVLAWKFPEGKSTTTIQDTDSIHALTFGDQKIQSQARQILVRQATAGKRGEDGSLEVVEQILQFRADMQLQGMKLSFDSRKRDNKVENPDLQFLHDTLKRMAGIRWTTTLKDRRVAAVKVDTSFLEGAKEATRQALTARFNPTRMRDEQNQMLVRFPAKAVRKGQTWQRTETARLGAGQNLRLTRLYRYDGAVEREGRPLAKISVTTTAAKLTMDPDSKQSLNIVGSDLAVVASSGSILFDPRAGDLVEERQSMHIKGALTLSIDKKRQAGSLELKSSSRVQRR